MRKREKLEKSRVVPKHYKTKVTLLTDDVTFSTGELFFFRTMKEEMLSLRRRILEGHDPVVRLPFESEFPEAIEACHDIARGGNVFIDCSILLELRQGKDVQLEKCQAKFQEMYSPGAGITLDMIRQASHSVIQVYDFRANVRLLKRWKEANGANAELGQKIEEMCEETASLWETWEKGPKTGTPPDIDIESGVEEIRKLYNSFDHGPGDRKN